MQNDLVIMSQSELKTGGTQGLPEKFNHTNRNTHTSRDKDAFSQ